MALAEDRGFSLSRFFISLLSLLVVLSSIFHRLCDAQSEVSFDCTTLQPTGIPDAFMGSDNSDYTVTVDQPYFQQGSIRRVTVSAGDLVFTHLFLQARTQDGVVIGGWTSPLPAGYHFYFQCNSGQSIRKLGTQTNKTITFEWMPPSADTSENVFFIATFVNTQIYFIVQSDEISDPCVPSPCSVGDVCFRGSSAPGYICTACEAHFCHNGGQCMINSAFEAQCLCMQGFGGTRCQLPREGTPCFSNPCSNGGSCRNEPDGSYTCTCMDSFAGENCETPTFCSNQPCQNGGTCVTIGASGGACNCVPGFKGGFCEEADPCHDYCFNGATCIPVTESFAICQCLSGFSGTRCQTTGPCADNPCLNGGTCVSDNTAPSGFACQCLNSYVGTFCQYVNPCQGNSPCQNQGTCVANSDGSYTCECSQIFIGDHCETLLPCLNNPCNNGGTCSNVGETYSCSCGPAFSGPNCEIENLCILSSPCMNGGSCISTGHNTYTCRCPSDFMGQNCETNQNPCFTNRCQNGGTCTRTSLTEYSCTCPSHVVGFNCDIANPCNSVPCFHGSPCTPSSDGSSYTCDCPPRLTGPNCDRQVDLCSDSPCVNGTCVSDPSVASNVRCICQDGFSGENCEILDDQNPCFTNRCQNGGTCTRTSLTEYSCACPSHVVGFNCDIANPCNSVPCFHGSPCTPSSDGSSYTCDCPPRLTGPNCDRQVDLCSDSPCVNGTCVSDPSVASNVRCICQDGFSGENCEILDDYCEAFKPCLNGGTCTSTGSNSDYSCECRSGYDGANCLIDLSDKPQFTGCPGVTVSFAITSNSNLANITINPRATVPETGEELSFDVIVGPLIQFPSAVMYDDIYSEGQKFMLRARDDYGRENTCSFTVRLTDQVPPTIECPDDYRDISVADTVEVSSLPLQPITRSDNIGLREAIEFSPSEVSADGRPRRITVSAYDLAGNKEECSFQLTISRRDTTCPEIPGDNGQVSCSLDGSGDRVCRLSCDDGFAAVNGEFYTCRNERWDKDPVPCAATTKPVSVAKIVSFVFPLSGSSCSGSVFLVDAAETMRNKLDELNLCRINSARACEPDSIVARCPPANGDSTRRRRRQDSGGEVEIDVEVSAVVDESTDESVGDVESDVNSLVRNIEEAEEGLVLTFGDDTVQYSSRMSSQNFIVACPRGSVSRNGSCITCPAGSSHDEQADECSLCEAGKYQPMDGQSSCLACDPGTYQGGRGASRCDECPDNISAGESSCLTETPPFDWVMIVIYICVGIGAFLVVVIFILMVCLWRSTQEEKKQDQKRWEIGQLTQLNKSYDPEPEPGFRPRVNTTVSASTYQTVPEGDGTPNLGNGHTNSLVPIPLEELYSGIMTDSYGNMLSVGVDTHPVPHPRDQRIHHSYDYDSYHDNGFMSSSYDRRDFPI